MRGISARNFAGIQIIQNQIRQGEWAVGVGRWAMVAPRFEAEAEAECLLIKTNERK